MPSPISSWDTYNILAFYLPVQSTLDLLEIYAICRRMRQVLTFPNEVYKLLALSKCEKMIMIQNANICFCLLPHSGRDTQICVSKETSWVQIMAWPDPATSHDLNQWWNIISSNIRNRIQRNIKRNSYIFIQDDVFENVICEMAGILSRPQYVNRRITYDTFI